MEKSKKRDIVGESARSIAKLEKTSTLKLLKRFTSILAKKLGIELLESENLTKVEGQGLPDTIRIKEQRLPNTIRAKGEELPDTIRAKK